MERQIGTDLYQQNEKVVEEKIEHSANDACINDKLNDDYCVSDNNYEGRTTDTQQAVNCLLDLREKTTNGSPLFWSKLPSDKNQDETDFNDESSENRLVSPKRKKLLMH